MKFLSFEWPSFERIDKRATELRLANEKLLKELESRVEVEIWQSSQNRHERHYFIRNGQHAYQDGQYLCGVNPELVTPEQERAILAILGYVLD